MGGVSRGARGAPATGRAPLLWAGTAALVLGGAGCRSSDGLPLNRAAAVTATVGVEGGTLESPSGDRLDIPAGALRTPETLTLTPVDTALATGPAFGAVDLAPDGLTFDAPLTLRLRLSQALPPGTELSGLSSHAFLKDSTSLSVTGAVFVVDASGLYASGQIQHFSTKAAVQNCHAGTRDMLFEHWEGVPGRDPAALAAATGLSPAALGVQPGDDQYSPNTLQTVLHKLFRPCGELPPGTPSSPELAASLQAAAARGEAVVALFGGSMVRDPNTQLFQGVSHSGIVTLANGQLVVRSRLNLTAARIDELAACGKPVRVDQPFSEIDQPGHGLRDLRNSEIYPYLVHGELLPNRDVVPRAYPHVLFYCEELKSCTRTTTGKSDDGCPADGTDAGDGVDGTDADGGDGADASDAVDASDGVDARDGGDGAPCPEYPLGPDGCVQGFSFSRETIACEQTECPAGAGRTYTLECCCNCWDDKSLNNVYDPCRAGYLLACEPTGP